MRHGGEIDHEPDGPEMIDCGLPGLRARGQYPLFPRGDGKLTGSWTERNHSTAGGHQTRDVTFQEGRQGQAPWNILASRAGSKTDCQGRLNSVGAEYFRKPVQDAIG